MRAQILSYNGMNFASNDWYLAKLENYYICVEYMQIKPSAISYTEFQKFKWPYNLNRVYIICEMYDIYGSCF